MPCDSITTQSVVLTKALPELIKSALAELGFTIESATAAEISARRGYTGESVRWSAGKGLEIRASAARVAEIQGGIVQSYSRAAVAWSAQRAGWTVTQTAPNKLTLNRR